MRVCNKCNGAYPNSFFTPCNNKCSYYKWCIGCWSSRSDRDKFNSKVSTKVLNTIRSHAEKYIILSKANNFDDFVAKFGWYKKRLIVE